MLYKVFLVKRVKIIKEAEKIYICLFFVVICKFIFIYIISVISIFDIFERSYAPFSVTTTGLDKKPGFNST